MKTRYCILAALAMMTAACTQNDESLDFGIDETSLTIGADGGTRTVKISSSDNWVAMTDQPWITVSPANGRGSTECKVLIDSALTDRTRTGMLRIRNQNTLDDINIEITQEGYEYRVALDNPDVTIPYFAAYNERYFDVTVKTNAEFDVEVPEETGWLTFDTPKFNLNRGIRPREVTIRFNWQISSQPERIASVKFIPRSVEARTDDLHVRQQAAPPIEVDTRAGDSVALLGIARALDTWYSWESAEPMDNWENVVLWEDGMEGFTPEKAGRVKSADFYLFATREGIPYEVQYLTAAEELSFRSNENSFLYDLDPGPYITDPKLCNLKRLTIDAYGLTSLSEDFMNLTGLEYLSLASNNFERFPPVLRKENMPSLKHLIMNANQRQLIYDLSNDSRSNIGGFYAESGPTATFPRWLLEWDTLETLVVSVNYLQGTLPALDDEADWPVRYTEADVNNSANKEGVDSLPRGNFYTRKPDGTPEGIVGLPKVWPNMKQLAINLNRFTGLLPDWLLYHPALDWWSPFILIFNQEGKDELGRSARFDNEPTSKLEYYYDFYKTKKNPYADSGEEVDD